MRQFQITLLFLLLSGMLTAQDYFQQEVDYKIAVTLDDETDEVFGTLELTYTNNSPRPTK